MSGSATSWMGSTGAQRTQAPQLALLFFCDGCHESIPANKARIHCQSCPDFDLCANCFVVGTVAGNHGSHHPTTVLRQSGTPSQAPAPTHSPPTNPQVQSNPVPYSPAGVSNGLNPSIQPPLAPSPVQQQNQYPPPPRRLSQQPPPAPSRSPAVTTPPQASYTPPSPLPQPIPQASAATSTFGWQPLFNGNLASPIFVALLNDIFTYLDRQRTNYLTPEVYSGWLDAQGYALEHNVWKKCLTPVFGNNKEDIADAEWKNSLDNFSIEYILAPRNAAPNNDFSNLVNGMNNVHLNTPGVQSIIQACQPKSVSGGRMPLLTRKGFIDITTVETLYDPSEGWGNLNRALRQYGIWQTRGPVPREMLPAFPPQAILDQVKRIGEMARYKAQQQIDAKHAELKMKQRGQQAALDLLDDRRYYYY